MSPLQRAVAGAEPDRALLLPQGAVRHFDHTQMALVAEV